MEAKANRPLSTVPPQDLLTDADAERILGEPAHITDSSWITQKDTSIYKSTFTADARDPKTGKIGVLYFLFEQYGQISTAKHVYSSIKTANEYHGIKLLEGIGDEAYFHTDAENFYFILVRKGTKMFRMKVNKITSTTSLDDFNSIAKNIAAAL